MATLATIPIPLTTINGQQVFGPAAIPVGVSWATFAIDRTVGLNSQPAATISAQIEISLDGGTNWQPEFGGTDVGGIQVIRGVQKDTWVIKVSPIAGDPASNQRRARMTVTTNMAVPIQGTLTLGN